MAERGLRAWNAMIRRLGGRPDVDPITHEQADLELLGLPDDAPGSGRRSRWKLLAAGAAASALAAAAIGGAYRLVTWDALNAKFWIAAGNVLFLSGFLAAALADRRSHVPTWSAGGSGIQRSIVRKGWLQFLTGWSLLLVSWVVLYAWLAVHTAVAQVAEPSAAVLRWSEALGDLINVSTAFFFLFLYHCLDKPSVAVHGARDRDRLFRRSVFQMAVACGAVGLLAFFGRVVEPLGLSAFAEWLGPLLVGVAMTHFVLGMARGYTVLERRKLMLTPLVVYALIQTAWPDLARDGASAAALSPNAYLCLALLLKVFLCVLVTDWVRSGQLEMFLHRVQPATPQPPAEGGPPAASPARSRAAPSPDPRP